MRLILIFTYIVDEIKKKKNFLDNLEDCFRKKIEREGSKRIGKK